MLLSLVLAEFIMVDARLQSFRPSVRPSPHAPCGNLFSEVTHLYDEDDCEVYRPEKMQHAASSGGGSEYRVCYWKTEI
jgi:hypothetical protein